MQSCFLSFACTPRCRVCAHHAIMCTHTTSCACTPCHHVRHCVHTTPSCAHTPHCVCTPRHCVPAHHAIVCMHTMPSCACTPYRVCTPQSCVCTSHHCLHTPRRVCAHHTVVCTIMCTPHCCVCAHHAVVCISVKSHSKVMWPLISANQKAPFSQISLTLWEIVRFHPKFFPHLKSKAVITALLKINHIP